ncbi:arginase family protein [Sphingomonas gei]|uniref:Arginase family protein n=1 Tax=Sphingomonas gei TaxID=1395960 RepID=A0A4S1X8C5_9SPHN|nr:arginase family protein [Sphingomonas gei]TGX52434.1 arginase family protein [Sphingomonas gei]
MTVASLFGWPNAAGEPAGDAIEIVGVPSDSGNSIASGARFGPDAIRRASLVLRPDANGIDRGDIGDVHDGDWQDVLERVENAVNAIVRRGSRPVLLGGDHAISYAAVAALRECRPLNILWFDAHTDFCAWPNAHWHNHKQVLRRIAGLDHVARIVQVGHRGITYFDEASRFDRMTVVTARAAREAPAETILEHLPRDEPVYMSIDIDAVDPRWAPGTGHPVPGGLSVARLRRLARVVADNREVVGLDMMEVNPLLDDRDRTSAAAAAILAELVPALMRRSHH